MSRSRSYVGVVRHVLVLSVAALSAVVATPPTSPSNADPEPQPGATRTADGRLLLVFDSSGSMEERDASGATKIDAAKRAFGDLVPRLPDSARVGLRVYGATVFDKSDPGACRDTQLAVPIGPVDKPAMKRAVAGFRPYGETPLAYSLRQGAEDLGTSGKRTILLVSDGEETCDPNPCVTARKISGLGIDLKIDVVGFDVTDQARTQLRCIADAGNGTFYEADDADDLVASLERLSIRAFRPFRVKGTTVLGTPTPADAPELEPGQYVDSAPAKGEPKHYRVRRSTPGSTLYVGASARPGPGNTVTSLHLETSTVDGRPCGYGLGTKVSYARTNPLVTASTSSWDRFASSREECQNARELVLSVGQSSMTGSGAKDSLSDVPVEILVVEEPPVTNAAQLPPAADGRVTWTDPPGGKATSVVAGASFSDAPTLRAGSYQTSLFPGEVQFFRVHLDWAQRLEADVRIPTPTAELAELTDDPQGIDVNVIGPTRGDARARLSTVAGLDQVFLDDATEARAQTMTADVRYANRDAFSTTLKSTALAGDYYVAVSLGQDRDRQSYLLPVQLSIGVDGEPGAGAPEYAGGRQVVGPGAGGRAEPRPDADRGPDPSASSDTPGPASGGDGRVAAENSGAGSSYSPRIIAIFVFSAIAVVLLVASVVRAIRRRVGTPRRRGLATHRQPIP